MRALLMAAVILAVGVGICSASWADLPYSAQIVAAKSATSPNTWVYTVRNTSTSSDYVLWLFGIEVDELNDVATTVTPSGWSADTDSQPHFITWMYYAGELEAGGAQSGFQAVYSGPPAFQNFTALFDNAATGEVPSIDGIVQTPEPATAVILLTGLAPIAGIALRRRRK
jgi:hypothetical protein